MNQLADPGEGLYVEIQLILAEARQTVAQNVNTAMVHAYWHIVGLIESHLSASTRSEAYGQSLLDDLSKRLRTEFGTGFDTTNFINIRRFHRTFEIPDAPRQESFGDRMAIDRVGLSWTHYRQLMRVNDTQALRRKSKSCELRQLHAEGQ